MTPTLKRRRGLVERLYFSTVISTALSGPDFVSMEESDCYAFGSSMDQAIANYAMKTGP
jgi:hypothetical protein